MEQYISKSALIAEIERRINEINLDTIEDWRYRLQREHDIEVMRNIISLIDTLEVKEVSEVPANVMLNHFGNKYISSWGGLKEYDNFQVDEEIKILIPNK